MCADGGGEKVAIKSDRELSVGPLTWTGQCDSIVYVNTLAFRYAVQIVVFLHDVCLPALGAADRITASEATLFLVMRPLIIYLAHSEDAKMPVSASLQNRFIYGR